jgi:hypothetical protein
MIRPVLQMSPFLAMAVILTGCASINPQHHDVADEEFVIPWSEGEMSANTIFNGVRWTPKTGPA